VYSIDSACASGFFKKQKYFLFVGVGVGGGAPQFHKLNKKGKRVLFCLLVIGFIFLRSG
jgi:hypothetical protein